MPEEKVPKSLAKAATKNMKVIKRYEMTKKERINRIIRDSKKKKLEQQDQSSLEEKKERFLANQAFKKENEYCTVECFERSVYLLEGIRVVLRAPTYATVRRYTYKKRCSNDTIVHDFINRRIKSTIDSTYQIYIVSDKPDVMNLKMGDIRKYHKSNK